MTTSKNHQVHEVASNRSLIWFLALLIVWSIFFLSIFLFKLGGYIWTGIESYETIKDVWSPISDIISLVIGLPVALLGTILALYLALQANISSQRTLEIEQRLAKFEADRYFSQRREEDLAAIRQDMAFQIEKFVNIHQYIFKLHSINDEIRKLGREAKSLEKETRSLLSEDLNELVCVTCYSPKMSHSNDSRVKFLKKIQSDCENFCLQIAFGVFQLIECLGEKEKAEAINDIWGEDRLISILNFCKQIVPSPKENYFDDFERFKNQKDSNAFYALLKRSVERKLLLGKVSSPFRLGVFVEKANSFIEKTKAELSTTDSLYQQTLAEIEEVEIAYQSEFMPDEVISLYRHLEGPGDWIVFKNVLSSTLAAFARQAPIEDLKKKIENKVIKLIDLTNVPDKVPDKKPYPEQIAEIVLNECIHRVESSNLGYFSHLSGNNDAGSSNKIFTATLEWQFRKYSVGPNETILLSDKKRPIWPPQDEEELNRPHEPDLESSEDYSEMICQEDEGDSNLCACCKGNRGFVPREYLGSS